MPRRARRLLSALVCACLAACFAVWASPVAAHGPAPSALSIIDEDASGPTFVRLNGGLARRDGADSFRYLCPAAWGDEVVLPAAKIPGGPVAIAGGRGVYLLDADGRVSPHPDANGVGPTVDFAQLGDALYLSRIASGMTQILEVRADAVRTVLTEPGSWSAIAATDSELALQRVNEGQVEELRITAEGQITQRRSVKAPDDAYLVIARATAREFYSVVATPSGRELGQIGDGGWQKLEVASASIAGPVDVQDGGAVVAVDTALVRLLEPRVAFEGAPPVSCLGEFDAKAYACTRDGVSALGDSGLTEPIFALSALLPPDLALAPEAQRDACELQWEHFRFDLLALGVPLRETRDAAGAPAPPPTAAGSGGVMAAAGARAPEPEDGDEPPRSESGCSTTSPRSNAASFQSWFALAALFAFESRRRRRRSAVAQPPLNRP